MRFLAIIRRAAVLALKIHQREFFLFAAAVFFFFIYLFLYLNPVVSEISPNKFVGRGQTSAYFVLNSPDEAANFFFIRQLVFFNKFYSRENLNALALNQVHPRSATVVNKNIVPISFPGFIVLSSLIIKLLSFIFSWNLFNVFATALTPAAGALTSFFFYGLLKRIFDKKIAFVSAFLLFILPPWWYYASISFQHNTFFVFLLVAACYFYFLSRESSCEANGKRAVFWVFFSTLAAGLAVYVRPSEIIWLGALCFAGIWQARKILGIRGLFAIAAALLLSAALFFITQFLFYNSFFGSGYVQPTLAGEAGSIFSGPQGINFWQAIFLPFGFHPSSIANNVVLYFFYFFKSWTLLFLAGLFLIVFLFKNKLVKTARFFSYAKFFFPIAAYILIFYGSWNFYDNLLRIHSIGTSYVRYFLPIYVFSLPFGAFFIVYLWQIKRKIAKVLTIFLLAGLFAGSYNEVFLKLDGLNMIKETVSVYKTWQEKIYRLTEPEAIIVTKYADKYIFPGRRVITGLENDEQLQAIVNLSQDGQKIYWYDLKLNELQKKALADKLNSRGLSLSEPVGAWENLELRRIGLTER